MMPAARSHLLTVRIRNEVVSIFFHFLIWFRNSKTRMDVVHWGPGIKAHVKVPKFYFISLLYMNRSPARVAACRNLN